MGSIEKRREYIKRYKRYAERQLRLRLLKPVIGKLPTGYVKATESYFKADEVHEAAVLADDRDAARIAAQRFARASDAYNKALQSSQRKIEALHAKECPGCPWDGETIFTRQRDNGDWY